MKKKIKKYSTLIVPLLLIMILVSDKVAYACTEGVDCVYTHEENNTNDPVGATNVYKVDGAGTNFATVTTYTVNINGVVKTADFSDKQTAILFPGVKSDPDYKSAVNTNNSTNDNYQEQEDNRMGSAYDENGLLTTNTPVGNLILSALVESTGCKTYRECTDAWVEVNKNGTGGVQSTADLVVKNEDGTWSRYSTLDECRSKNSSCDKNLGHTFESVCGAQGNTHESKVFGTTGNGDPCSLGEDPDVRCTTPPDGGDPGNPDVPNNPSTPPSSGGSDDEYREKQPLPTIPKQSFHEDEPGNFECGKPYKEVRYEKGPSMAPTCDGEEGWPYFEIKTTYSVSAFSAPTSVTAGQSFGASNVNASVKTEVIHAKGGSAMVKAALDKNKTEISNIKDVTIFNLNQDIKNLQDDIDAAYKKWDDKYCGYYDDNTCTKCADDPKKTCCAYHGDCTRAKAQLYNDYMTIKTKNDKEIKEKEKAIEEENEKLKKLEEKKEHLEICRKEYNSNLNASKAGNLDVNSLSGGKNPLDTTNTLKQQTTLTIGGTTQSANSVTGFTKGSGGLSTTSGNNTIPSNGQFSIPVGIANKSTGQVSTTIELAGKTLTAVCPIRATNSIICTDNCVTTSSIPSSEFGGDGGSEVQGLNLVYRPISLTNPFPKIYSSSSRDAISIWSAQTTRNTIINNNRGVADYQVYSLEPMYEITLTPATIKRIRNDYNKSHKYDDYTLTCTNGMECKSSFLRNFLGSAVKQSTCGLNSDWYACDSNEAKELKKHFLQVLN